MTKNLKSKTVASPRRFAARPGMTRGSYPPDLFGGGCGVETRCGCCCAENTDEGVCAAEFFLFLSCLGFFFSRLLRCSLWAMAVPPMCGRNILACLRGGGNPRQKRELAHFAT